MFTLALCIITIWAIDSLKEKIDKKIFWYAVSIIIVVIFCFLAMKLNLDYDYHAIIIAYLFKLAMRVRGITFKNPISYIEPAVLPAS